jgi:hypothetical protein
MTESFKPSFQEGSDGATTKYLDPDPDKESRHEDQKQARIHRENAIKKIYLILASELVFLAIILVIDGFDVCNFHLGDSVFNILISGVMLQTFGLMVIVFKYLFGGITYK